MRKFPYLILALLLLLPYSATFAQSEADSFLNFIKNKLGQQEIEVIDYSTPQTEWGAIPGEWAKFLIEEGYDDLSELADEYEVEFEGDQGLNRLRYELGVLESQRTRADTQTERDDLQIAIEDKQYGQDGIEDLEEEVKDAISRLSSVEKISLDNKLAPVEGQPEVTFEDGPGETLDYKQNPVKIEPEEIVNLIFREINFYYSQVKWGVLPYPITVALREENSLWDDEDTKSIRTLENIYSDMEELSQSLQGIEYEDENGDPQALNESQIEQIVQEVVASRYEGERQLNQVLVTTVGFIRNIIGSLAILWIVVMGIRMATANGDETIITDQKRGILYAAIGLGVILLIERLIVALYGSAGELRNELVASAAFDAEIYGIVSFIRALVGIIAILFIVRAGFLSIVAEEEDKVTQNRKSIIYILIGIVIIAVNRVVVENVFIGPNNQDDQIYSSNLANIISLGGNILRFALGFVGLIALAALVYGGANLVLHYGNDEMAEKSKKIIKSALIGILIVISAYTIVATLVVFK